MSNVGVYILKKTNQQNNFFRILKPHPISFTKYFILKMGNNFFFIFTQNNKFCFLKVEK